MKIRVIFTFLAIFTALFSGINLEFQAMELLMPKELINLKFNNPKPVIVHGLPMPTVKMPGLKDCSVVPSKKQVAEIRKEQRERKRASCEELDLRSLDKSLVQACSDYLDSLRPGHLEIIKDLLEKGADPNTLEWGHGQTNSKLVQRRAYSSQYRPPLLHDNIHDIALLGLLLSYGAHDINNKPDGLDLAPPGDARDIIMRARLLIEYKANVNYHLPGRYDALTRSLAQRDIPLAQLLIDAKANPAVAARNLSALEFSSRIGINFFVNIGQYPRIHVEKDSPQIKYDQGYNEVFKKARTHFFNEVIPQLNTYLPNALSQMVASYCAPTYNEARAQVLSNPLNHILALPENSMYRNLLQNYKIKKGFRGK